MKRYVVAVLLASLPASAGAYTFVSRQGCPAGKGAAWPDRLLPTVWSFNQDGYANDHGLSFEDTRAAVERGITAWEEPCCSAFRSKYGGTTIETALGLNAPPDVVSFRTSNWAELGLGASTIAVTWPQWNSSCELIGADLLFNAVNFSFQIDGTDTDLQSIATHEFGHWLGLGHTTVPGATMLATYLGGVAQRSLEQDDEDGLCTLYPGDCHQCAADADCAAGETCNDQGACKPLPCDSNDGCPAGSACISGACRAGCRTSDECADGQQCMNASCVSSCTICSACLTAADCGAYGYQCVDLGDGLRCTEPCSADADCDGDSLCLGTSPAGIKVCVAPDGSRTTLCPVSYQCQLITGCPGLWLDCTMGCPKGADACVSWEGKHLCSCSCTADSECGQAAACHIPDGQTTGDCVPRKVLDPCWNVSCRDDQVCNGGRCVLKDPCSQLTCPPDRKCQVDTQGLAFCYAPCGACPVDTVCNWDTSECDPVNHCDSITCPAGQVCNRDTQACEDACARVTCDAGQRCKDGGCVDACQDVTCAATQRCDGGTCVPLCDCGPTETCVDGACKARPVPHPVVSRGCSGSGGPASLAGLALALLVLGRRRRS